MAAFSRDPDLLRIIAEDRDLHCHTVRCVWPETAALSDDEIKEMSKAEPVKSKKKRDLAKITFFLSGYGGGKFKLSESLLIPPDEAGHIINTLKYQAFPKLTSWKEEEAEKFRQTGVITLPCGYKRRLKGWENAKDPQRALSSQIRSSVNTIIQGTSAEMMKSAWFRVEDALKAAGIPYQIKILIHDQMVFMVHRKDAVAAAGLCEQHMYSELFGVPVPAEVEIKLSLSKSKDSNAKDLEQMFKASKDQNSESLSSDTLDDLLDLQEEVYL